MAGVTAGGTLARATAVLAAAVLAQACTPQAPRPTDDAALATRAPRNRQYLALPAEPIRGLSGAPDSFGVSLDTLTGRLLDSFLLDGLAQVYEWSPDGTLRKFVTATDVLDGGAVVLRYRNPRLGPIASVDLTNPLRPVLFYDDAQTVVWLDRNLTELRELSLVDLDLGQVDAVAYARNDGLWVYAPDRQRLLLLDRNNAVAQESPHLAQAFGTPVRARELAATPQQVALATRAGRLLLFGPFAAYRTQILRPAAGLVVDGERVLFHEAGRWYALRDGASPPAAVEADARGRLLMVREGRALWQRGDRVWVE